jgi:hypothetical protein
MKRYLARATCGVLCITAAVTVGSLPASASARHSTAGISMSAPRGTTAGIWAASDSTYLAGYTDTPAGGLVSVGATLKIPKLTCGSTTEGIFLGVGDETTLGSPTELSGAFIGCSGGSPFYDLGVNANGIEFIEPGNAGDTIVVSFYQTASTVTDVVHDLTAGTTWVADAAPVPDTTATTGAFPAFDGSDTPILVPKFTPVTFSQCQLNGDYLGFAGPTQLNRVNGTHTEISTGALPVTSDTFKLTYKHA